MASSPSPEARVRTENAELRARLEEAEETLRSIRSGEVDALIVETADGPQVFTLQGLEAESNRFRGEILAQVSDAVIAVDAEERVTYLNAAAERQYRVSGNDVLGRQLSQIFSRQWASAEAEAAMWAAFREHGEWRGEATHRAHDARELAVETSITALRDESGVLAGYVSVIRDITDRKRSAEQLQRVNLLLDTLLLTAPVGFCFLDRDLRYVRINERLAEINGIPVEAHLGRHVSEIVPSLVEPLRNLTARILATGQAVVNHEFSGETPAAPGEMRFWSESWYPLRDGAGEVLGFGGIVEEITARKRAEAQLVNMNENLLVASIRQHELTEKAEWLTVQLQTDLTARMAAEEALRESQHFIHSVLYNLFAFVGVMTVDGTLTDANRSSLEAAGIPAGEVLGKKFWDCYWWSYSPEIQAQLRDACERAAGGQVVRYDVPVRMAGDTRVWIDFQLSPLRDTKGRITHLIPSALEIEVRHAAEKALRESEEHEREARAEAEAANRSKDTFLATLSHELRTPLNAILGWAVLLRTTPPADGKPIHADIDRGLAIIERNARVQGKLIEDVLDVARITSGKFILDLRPLDLTSLVLAAVDAVRPAAEGKGLNLEVAGGGRGAGGLGSLWVHGDSSRLQQAVSNLLTNAVKFTPKGGRVAVNTELVKGTAADTARITVTDTGMGIDAAFIQSIFERFKQAGEGTTRSYGGLGLGLAVVRHIIEAHGGTAHATSQGDGTGATFTLELPATPQPATPLDLDKPIWSVNLPPLDGVLVLVVDDEEDSRLIAKRALESAGAIVVLATSAEEGYHLAMNGKGGKGRAAELQVVVSDIGMPGEDGYSMMRRMRTEMSGTDLPAVAMTAFAAPEDKRQALVAGFQAHMAKPIDPHELIAVVAGLVGGAERTTI